MKYNIYYITVSARLDVIQWFVGDVGGDHVLDLHGNLGVRLDDAFTLYLDRPDRLSGRVLSPGEKGYDQSNQGEENYQTNQTDS